MGVKHAFTAGLAICLCVRTLARERQARWIADIRLGIMSTRLLRNQDELA